MFRRVAAVTPAARVVDSPRNAGVKRARALERDRALREREGTYLAWGVHLAQEALLCRAPVRQAFVGPRLAESPDTAAGDHPIPLNGPRRRALSCPGGAEQVGRGAQAEWNQARRIKRNAGRAKRVRRTNRG